MAQAGIDKSLGREGRLHMDLCLRRPVRISLVVTGLAHMAWSRQSGLTHTPELCRKDFFPELKVS